MTTIDIKEAELRNKICEIGKRLFDKSYVSGTGGNISVKLSDNRFLITPSRRNKGFLKPEDIVMIDLPGNELEDGLPASSEKPVHLQFYRELHDINAIVHAHPPVATAFAVADQEIDCSYLPETMVFLGMKVPLVPYETPSTLALPDNFAPFIDSQYRAYLMQNHGTVTTGVDLDDAYNNLETLELYAKTLMYAGVIGTPKAIPLGKIKELKKKFDL